MSTEGKEYTLRLSMVGGKPMVTSLNEIGTAGEKNFFKVKASGDMASLAIETFARRAVGAFTVGALANSLKNVIGDLSDLNDTAARLDLNTDQLQEYRYAAVNIGEAADDMNAALFTFTENLGAAQNGTGKFLEVLKDYNIALKDGNGLNRSTQAVLRDYTDAISQAADQQEKLFLSQKGFGDGPGKSLIEVFERGSAGLDAFAQQARETGNVINQELIERADELDESFKRITSTVENSFKAGIVLAVTDIQEEIDNLIGKTGVLIELMKRTPAARILFGGRKMFDDQPFEAGNPLLDYFMNKNSPHEGLTDADPELLSAGGLVGNAGRKFSRGHNDTQREVDQLQKVIEALVFRNEQMKRTNEEQELYNQLRAAGVTIDSAAGQKIKEQVDQYNELAAAKKADEEQTKRNKDAARELGLVFKSAFEDAIVEGKGLSEVLKGLEQDFVRVLARKMVTEPLAQAAGNLFDDLDFGSIFGAEHHTGGIAGRGSVGRTVPAAAFIGAPRFHGGGFPGLRSNEVPAILEQGEGVFTRQQMSALGSGGRAVKVELNVINEFPEAKVEKRQGSKGEPELVIRRMVEGTMRSAIGSGAMDTIMDGRFGIKPRTS
jgi:hypothetical protein